MGARGNSGVILSQVLRGFAGVVSGVGKLDGPTLSAALRAASDAAYQAVMRPVEGTILTVVRASAEATEALLGTGGDGNGSGGNGSGNGAASLIEVTEVARAAAAEALAKTPEQLPVLADAGV